MTKCGFIKNHQYILMTKYTIIWFWQINSILLKLTTLSVSEEDHISVLGQRGHSDNIFLAINMHKTPDLCVLFSIKKSSECFNLSFVWSVFCLLAL